MPKNKSKDESILLGARIKAVRKMIGYKKAADFLKELSLPHTLYYQWELGRRTPDDESLKKISDHCMVSFDWLKTGKGNIFKNIKINSNEAKEKEALISYELLTSKQATAKQEEISANLKHKIISYASKKPIKTTETSIKNVVYAINTELMTAILKTLIETFNKSKKSLDAESLSKFTVQIYSDIVSNESDPTLQLKMIKPIVTTYERFFSN